ncbi:MAG: DEAD/DEAH box helicase [Peptococcaceae bacterium]|nr:DEAD/DEAH box helicase [Peptococcaceae bacterium]
MLVLHLSFHDDAWFVWAESWAEGRARSRRSDRVSPSPFGANIQDLAESLPLDLPSIKPVTAYAWFPTCGGVPSVSTPLIASQPAKNEDPTLQAWEVEALEASSQDVVQFLATCRGREMLQVGVLLGTDIRLWTKVLEFSASLVSRELYLPTIVERSNAYLARWEPYISGDDSIYQHALRQQMPGACFALCPSITERPPLGGLHTATSSLVDALVRRSAQPSALKSHSVHDAWLNSLKSPQGIVEGNSSELVQLVQHVAEWRKRLSRLTSSPHTFGFRAVESATLERPWRIEFMLRGGTSTATVKVEDVWPTANSDLQQFMLMAIGQATAICPLLEGASHASIPSGLDLTGSEILVFLSEYVPALRQVGFFIEVPSWWGGTSTKVRIALRAKVDSPSVPPLRRMTLNSLLSVQWEIALGGDTLSLEELEQLAQFNSPLVKLRGQWVQLEEGQLARTIKAVRAGNPRLSLARLLRATTGADELDAALPVEQVRASGWVGDLLAEFTRTKEHKSVPLPTDFVGSLRSYQVQGYSWLELLSRFGLGACLADDMGLGKTIQALTLLQHRLEAGQDGPYLLVCPTSIIFNWEKEAARFTPHLKLLVHHGPLRSRDGDELGIALQECNVVITSYTLAMRDQALLQGVEWEGIILDEAQNIKNPEAKQSKVIRSLSSGFRVALTGTPVENGVNDLWSIMEFLNPGLLGSQAEFRRHFLLPIHLYRDKAAVQRLKKITQPFILRRLKTDRSIIDDLPAKVESKVYCTLTREQAGLYAAVINISEGELLGATGMGRRGLILTTISKLKQICNDPGAFLRDGRVLPDRSGKLTRLMELAGEIYERGDKALIFTQYVEMGHVLVRALTEGLGQRVLFLHGGVRKVAREKLVESFQSPDGPPFFVLSLKAGGTGLNLTQASHVIHYDRWWNPAVEDQATDRAHRIGQDKRVQVHKFICAGTLEERIDEMISSKTTMSTQVVGTGETWLTELSTAELRELWKLSRNVEG